VLLQLLQMIPGSETGGAIGGLRQLSIDQFDNERRVSYGTPDSARKLLDRVHSVPKKVRLFFRLRVFC
jgi:hypothetical protein